jgi:hypothetical protein
MAPLQASHNGPANNSSALLELPIEMIMAIGDHLPDANRMCLALTCRSLYAILYLEPSRLKWQDRQDKQHFLLLMEKSMTGVFYCHSHRKLHSFSPDLSLDNWPQKLGCLTGEEFRCRSYQLPYELARLVTNRHLYGPAHGIPTSHIEKHERHLHSRLQIERRESWKARVIDNELFLRTTHTMEHWRGDTHMLRRFVDKCKIFICRHIESTERTRGFSRIQGLGDANGSKSNPGGFIPCERALTRCDECLVEVETTITCRGQRRKGWFVQVVVYRSLGECNRPQDMSLMIRWGVDTFDLRLMSRALVS